MLRRKILVAVVLLFCCVGWMLAGRSQASVKPIQNIDQALAAVPLPKLSAAEALDIANKLRHSRAPFDISTIVSIDWCKSSDFRPRYVDGADLVGLDNDVRMHGLSPISNHQTGLRLRTSAPSLSFVFMTMVRQPSSPGFALDGSAIYQQLTRCEN